MLTLTALLIENGLPNLSVQLIEPHRNCAACYRRRGDRINTHHEAKAARPDVPVIMITAYGDDSTRRKALEGGADALLTKPIDFVALRGEIDNRVAGAGAAVR
jgi:CheY-like chemotaxis protein